MGIFDFLNKNKQLISAVKNGQKDKVEKLLGKGANPNATCDALIPVLSYAAAGTNLGIMELLVASGANINGGSSFLVFKPLTCAADCGNEITVHWLVKNGADIESEGGIGGFPLRAAASQGHIKIVKYLLDHGAYIDQSFSDKTALSSAYEAGHTEIVELLLSSGAGSNITN